METVLVAADAIKRFKMYPYFDVAHYILNCMAVRDDHPPATGSCYYASLLFIYWGRGGGGSEAFTVTRFTR